MLLSNAADRRLLSDFLQALGHAVVAGMPAELPRQDGRVVSLLITDAASARQCPTLLATLRAQRPEIFVPVLIALPPTEPSAGWLQAGFDDVLRLPIAKSELAARVEAFLRLHDHSAEEYRQRAELAASEERFRSIFERTAVGMAVADPTGRLLQVNPALCQFLGYSADELKSGTLGAITHPDDRVEAERLFAESRAGLCTGFDIEKRYIRKDGALLWARAVAVFHFDAAQQSLLCIAIIQDITPRKRAEAERDRLNEDLRASRERMRLLTLQVIRAQEEERKRVSRDLHDELGQTLAVLKIGLRLLARELPLDTDVLRVRLNEASGLTDATIAQMRQIARDLRPVNFDTERLFAALESLCQNFAQRTSLEVQYNIGGEEPPLTGEMRISLYRFVQEALTNVAKHANARQVRVSADGGPGEIRISVTDDGQGFDVASRLTAMDDSLGIGLLGMRERLELLGGQLEIVSQPGQGTRLVARVPIADGD